METIAERATLRPGEMLNWYKIVRVLGRGGFGVTYLAQDINLKLNVAIKEYLPDAIAKRGSDNSVNPSTAEDHTTFEWGLKNFLTEARTLVKFKHSNIVRVMAVFESNGTAYMVMEYERGQDLKQLLAKTQSLNEAELKNLVLPIIDGLGDVHKHGFIHRDIKPANIYIREDNTPVLLDFGSARLALGGATQQLTSLVSVGYTPLEQYGNSIDSQQGPWTDIYSLGAVLYFAISGTAPVDSTLRASAVLNDRQDPLRPITDIGKDRYSVAFLSAIDWALEFKVSDRPRSLDAWRDRLDDDRTVLRPHPSKYNTGDNAQPSRLALRNNRINPVRTESGRAPAKPATDYFVPAPHRPDQAMPEPEPAFGPDDWELPSQQQSVLPPLHSAGSSSKRLWPLWFLLIGSPLVIVGYLMLASPERITNLWNSKTGSNVANVLSSDSTQDDATEDTLAFRRGAEQRAREDEAARQAEIAAQKARELETARQAEIAAQKAREQAAARRAEIAAQKAREQAASRQAEIAAQKAREQQAARQAELAAQKSREQEAAQQSNTDNQVAMTEYNESQEKRVAPIIPITDKELQTSAVRFDSLARAIRSRDLEKVKEIAPLSDLYGALFEYWFANYDEIDVGISGISANRISGRVNARVLVSRLVREDGSIVIPPEIYRSIPIYTERSGNSRSIINWPTTD